MPSPVPVESPSVWTSADFPDESSWSFDLSPDHRRALIEFGRGGRIGALEAVMRPSVQIADLLLNDGPGFVRFRGFPIEKMTEAELQRAYIGLGSLLGTPVEQDRNARLITHIRDERSNAGAGRRYQTNLSQDFHSDASDLVGLLCLRPARRGGLSKIVSSHAVYNRLFDRGGGLVEAMYAPMPWSRHTGGKDGTRPYFDLAPIADIAGRPRIFFIPWYIRSSQLHPDAPRLTAEQLAAMDLMEQTANDPTYQVVMEFHPGDVQLLNNTKVLHSRESYEDHEDPALRRHLLRVWLATGAGSFNGLLPGPSRKAQQPS